MSVLQRRGGISDSFSRRCRAAQDRRCTQKNKAGRAIESNRRKTIMTNDLGRRDSMKQPGAVALLAAPAVQSARGANDKVNIGWIGLRTRGSLFLGEDVSGQ